MKIIFVCTGNICRSAMAEYIMKEKTKDRKEKLEIYSCGTQAYDGEPATNYTIEVLRKHKIDGRMHRAKNLQNLEIQQANLILCATKIHKKDIQKLYPEKQKEIYTIKEYAYQNEKEEIDIADPWGYDFETYENCYIQIEKCITEILKRF